jgi:hypothetical protein
MATYLIIIRMMQMYEKEANAIYAKFCERKNRASLTPAVISRAQDAQKSNALNGQAITALYNAATQPGQICSRQAVGDYNRYIQLESAASLSKVTVSDDKSFCTIDLVKVLELIAQAASATATGRRGITDAELAAGDFTHLIRIPIAFSSDGAKCTEHTGQ